MIFGKKENVLRLGYNYELAAIVVEQKLNNGNIYTSVNIAGGPIYPGKGKTFEKLCEEWHVEEVKIKNVR